jgi:hypothetical protein
VENTELKEKRAFENSCNTNSNSPRHPCKLYAQPEAKVVERQDAATTIIG